MSTTEPRSRPRQNLTVTQRTAGARRVFRSTFGRVGAYVWFAFAAVNAIDVALRGSGQSSRIALAGLLAFSAVIYLFAFRPAVVADARGVVLRNVVREVSVPWSAVTAIDVTNALRVHAGGAIYRSWAEQVSSRDRARARSPRGRQVHAGGRAQVSDDVRAELSGRTSVDFVVDQLEEMRRLHAAAGDGAPRVRWAVPGLAVLAGSVLLLVAVIVAG